MTFWANGTDGLLLNPAPVVIIKLNNICENSVHIISVQLVVFLHSEKLTASNEIWITNDETIKIMS